MLSSDFSSERSSRTSSSSSSSLSAYKSMNDKTFTKRIQEATDSFLSILETFAVYSKLLHGIVALVRFLQLMGPSINAGNTLVWGTGNIFRFVNYISICWYLIPASAENLETSTIVCFVVSVVCLAHFLTFFLSALKIQKTMHISDRFAFLFNTITISLGYISLPIISSSFASLIGFFLHKFRKRIS